MKTKLLVLSFFTGIMLFPVALFAQSITLSYGNTSLKSVLKEIERQTEYSFVYSNTLDVNKTVSISAADKEIKEVLDILCGQIDLSYKINGKQIVLSPEASTPKSASYKKTVSGTVTDGTTGEPVPFASIVEAGTKNGIAADANGKYTITNVANNAKLIVSCIGYVDQTISAEGKNKLDIALAPDTQTIDETVVIAYGTAKKESITGAVSVVKSDEIAKRPITSVTDALEGSTSGVLVNSTYGEPGTDPTIRIRGVGSVNGSNTPLYILDGMPFGGNVSDLNPADIESITVLKDATSAALYGNRASNGVILITTKRGKSDKVSISATINQGIYTRGIPEYDKLEGTEWAQAFFTGYANYLKSTDPTKYPTKEAAIATARTSFGDLIGSSNPFNKPYSEMFDANGKILPDVAVLPGYTDLNWFDYIEQTGYRAEYNISGSGASEKSNYYFSLGYLDNNGQIKKSDFNRWTGRAKVNISPRKWIDVGFSINGSLQTINGTEDGNAITSNPLYFARVIAPVFPVFEHNEDGSYVTDQSGNRVYNNGEGWMQLSGRNAVWERELSLRQTKRSTIGAQAYTDIKFLKDFKFTVKADISVRNSRYRRYDSAIIGDGAGNNGRTYRTEYNYMNLTFQQLLNYNHTWGDFNFDALLGHESYRYNYEYQYGYKTDETFPDGYELNNFATINTLTGYQAGYNLESFFSRVKADYRGKYYLEASFRRDGTSRFATGNKWGNFWSVGGTWILSKEDFLKDVSAIDNLKLRASYGQVGNDASADYYSYYSLYGLYTYAKAAAAYKTQNEANDLVWESENSASFALESRFFDRLNFSVEYYNKVTNNLLFDVKLPASAGGIDVTEIRATTTKNIGSVVNKGFEFNIDGDVIKTANHRLNLSFNATTLVNKVLKLPEQNRKEGIINGTKRIVEGGSIYDYWMYQYAGVSQLTGLALYKINTDLYTTEAPQEGDSRKQIEAEWLQKVGKEWYTINSTYAKKDWCGNSLPKIYGSFGLNYSFKQFDISALFTYGLGSKVIDYSYQSLMKMSTAPSSLHANLLNAWQEAPAGVVDADTDYLDPKGTPVLDMYYSTYGDATSSRYLISGDYLVFKSLTAKYRFPKRVCEKMNISALSISAAVDNIFSWTALKGMNSQQSLAGTIYNNFNTPRVATVGISVTF